QARLPVPRMVFVLVVLDCLLLGGCGTIINGRRQKVELAVDPPGTEVTFYQWTGEPVGGPARSPGEVTVQRLPDHRPYVVVATHSGYCPRYWIATGEDSGAYMGTLLVGGIIGLMVDSHTGGCCTISPSRIDGALEAGSQCVP